MEKALDDSGALMVREIYALKLVCEAWGYPADTLPIEIQEVIPKHKAEHNLMTGLQNRVSAEEHA